MQSIARSRFLALTGSAAVVGSSRPASAQDLKVVRVLGNPNDDSTSLYYALRSGMFRRAGIDVHIDTGTSGAQVAAAVIGGSYDIGKSSVTSIFEAHEKGIPFTIIAPASIQEPATPFAGTLVLKDSPIRTGKDLENQIVGVSSLSSIGRPAVCSWVESTGGDWRAVKFVEIPLTQAAAAVEQKRVVASETAQPMLATAIATGTFRTLPTYQTISPRFVLTTWFTTKGWSDEHADAARTFARVIADSAVYVNAHHAETVSIMAEAGNVDPAIISAMQRVVNGSVLLPALIQPTIDATARYGGLKASFPAQEIIDARAARR
jgi:NitT/TauT family transport system substrate-binding protein